jgi:hypothetical protein
MRLKSGMWFECFVSSSELNYNDSCVMTARHTFSDLSPMDVDLLSLGLLLILLQNPP